ncbi:MAG TPA: type II secretion system F family protein [Bryobacteraceae bacterium]|nr:type II secretion system F family protein [Bryobacteraceae bacterium]
MLLIITLIFLAVFAVVVLLFVGSGAGGSQQVKQSIERLNAMLAISRTTKSEDDLVDIRKTELFSAIPWLNAWLIRLDFAPRLRRVLYQADMTMTAGALLSSSLAGAVVFGYLAYLRTGAGLVALAIAAAAGAAPFLFVLQKRSRRFAKFEAALPGALDLMVSAMRAGQSLVSALGIVAREVPDPIGREFRICFDEQNYGLELRTAMQNLVTRVPLADMRIVVSAILIQKESGGNLAEVLDKTAQITRERFKIKKQIMVHTAQGRLTGWILTFLPVVLGFFLYFLNPERMSVLWKDPRGLKLMYIAAGMEIIGALIIRKIVRIRV